MVFHQPKLSLDAILGVSSIMLLLSEEKHIVIREFTSLAYSKWKIAGYLRVI